MILKAVGPTMNDDRVWVPFSCWHQIMVPTAHICTGECFHVDFLLWARLPNVTVVILRIMLSPKIGSRLPLSQMALSKALWCSAQDISPQQVSFLNWILFSLTTWWSAFVRFKNALVIILYPFIIRQTVESVARLDRFAFFHLTFDRFFGTVWFV